MLLICDINTFARVTDWWFWCYLRTPPHGPVRGLRWGGTAWVMAGGNSRESPTGRWVSKRIEADLVTTPPPGSSLVLDPRVNGINCLKYIRHKIWQENSHFGGGGEFFRGYLEYYKKRWPTHFSVASVRFATKIVLNHIATTWNAQMSRGQQCAARVV